MIRDPGIHEYYNVLRTITRGPIWSGKRLKEVAKINLGYYDHLVPRSGAPLTAGSERIRPL